MRIRKILKHLLVFSFTIIYALSNNSLTVNANSDPFDFSREGSLDTVNIKAHDIVENITGEKLSNIEIKFLDKNGVNLKYENKISSSCVSTSLIDNDLTIHAETYSYVDKQNNVITWIPYEASIDNQTIPFIKNGEKYDCYFENVTSKNLNVTYQASLFLEAKQVNELINSAYKTAKYYDDNNILDKEKEEYDAEYNRYLSDVEKYNQYLEDVENYLRDSKEYEQYLQVKSQYDEKLEKYNNYLKDLEKYEQEVKLYNEYLKEIELYDEKVLAYQNYLIEKTKYEEKYNKYLQEYEIYKPKREKVEYQLNAMDLIVTSMTSLDRNIYSAVMGGTVTEVLARKDELVQLNADAKVIDDAEDATYALRDIFSSYFGLKDEEAKYVYYKSNYISIKSNIEKLLRSLEKLYRSGLVSTAIEMFEKTDQYLILVAQLAVVANAIDDKPVYNYEGHKNQSNKNADIFDSSWTIENKTIMKILEYDVDFNDIDGYAYPLLEGYPKEPSKPTPIQVVEEPKYPKEVNKPISPLEVIHPGEAPLEVKKPIKPAEIKQPIEPKEYIQDVEKLDLIEAYKNGVLTERNTFTNNVDYKVFTSFTKNTNNLDVVSIEFYDNEQNFIAKHTTDYGSYIVYNDVLPSKSSDEKYSEYVFSHWIYEDGEVLDLNCVTREGFVYPVFVGKTLREYEVKWIINDLEFKEIYSYGEVPFYKDEIQQVVQGNHCYYFSCWDKEIKPVVENEEYIAIFNQKTILDENIKIIDSDRIITLQLLDEHMTSFSLGDFLKMYVTNENNKKIIIISDGFVFDIPASVVNKLKDNQADQVIVNIDNVNEYEQLYSVSLLDCEGYIINDNLEINVKILGSYSSKTNLYKVIDEHHEEPYRASISNNMLSFSMEFNTTYHSYATYKITVSSSEAIDISVSKNEAKYGDLIEVNITENIKGIISDVRIIDSNGQMIALTNNKFEMPNANIYIILSYEYIYYNVVFKMDDNIISSKEYKYGDEVLLPNDPIKSSDGKYTYTFIGWDKEVSSVTSDAVYSALFEAKEIEKTAVPKDDIGLIQTIKIVGVIVTIIMVVTVVVLIVFKKKSRKKRIKSSKKEVSIKFD